MSNSLNHKEISELKLTPKPVTTNLLGFFNH